MPTPALDQSKNQSSVANAAHYVKLDVSDMPSLSSSQYGTYAVLTVDASTVTASPTLSSSSVLENTAYQDVPFSAQVAVTASAAVITANANKGWITLSIDPDTADVVYIGAAGVATTTGTILKATNPSITISSDDLSEWFVIGAVGGEKLYVIGAYLS